MVREKGETGSDQEPEWSQGIDTLGGQIDSAVDGVVGAETLADLLDQLESE